MFNPYFTEETLIIMERILSLKKSKTRTGKQIAFKMQIGLTR